MKISELLTEAPLVHYEPIGDFEKSHGFRHDVDRRLATHPTNIQKIHTFLDNSPFDFRIFVVNMPGKGKYSETGAVDYNNFVSMFGKDIADKVYTNSENAVNIVYVGNSGDARVIFTPWIMAHRFGHAVAANYRMRDVQSPWRDAETYFFNTVNDILKTIYNKPINPRFKSVIDWEKPQEYNALFNAIGTMRSARTKQIKRPYEFFYECFAQYLKTGTVKFNPLPKNISYGRKAWGRDTKFMQGRNMPEDINDHLINFGETLSEYFDEVIRSAQGRVYVM